MELSQIFDIFRTKRDCCRTSVPSISTTRIDLESYIKFSLESRLFILESTISFQEPSVRESMEAERSIILSHYDAFLQAIRMLPPIPQEMFHLLTPKDTKHELYLRMEPSTVDEMLFFLNLLPAVPLAHEPNSKATFPWNLDRNASFRIFPYTIKLTRSPIKRCQLRWIYGPSDDNQIKLSLRLPNNLTKLAFNTESIAISNDLIPEGINPYIINVYSDLSKDLCIIYPKALAIKDGIATLRSWNDIPLLNLTENEANLKASVLPDLVPCRVGSSNTKVFNHDSLVVPEKTDTNHLELNSTKGMKTLVHVLHGFPREARTHLGSFYFSEFPADIETAFKTPSFLPFLLERFKLKNVSIDNLNYVVITNNDYSSVLMIDGGLIDFDVISMAA